MKCKHHILLEAHEHKTLSEAKDGRYTVYSYRVSTVKSRKDKKPQSRFSLWEAEIFPEFSSKIKSEASKPEHTWSETNREEEAGKTEREEAALLFLVLHIRVHVNILPVFNKIQSISSVLSVWRKIQLLYQKEEKKPRREDAVCHISELEQAF